MNNEKSSRYEREGDTVVCMYVCGERDDLVCFQNAKERGDLFWSFDYFASNYRTLSLFDFLNNFNFSYIYFSKSSNELFIT